MTGREEFERIKKRIKYLNDNYRNYDSLVEKELFDDCETLLNIIDIMDKRQQQEKMATESIKQIYKNVNVAINTSDDYFKDDNVNVEITDKFVIIRKKDGYQLFYNINKIEYFSIKNNNIMIK